MTVCISVIIPTYERRSLVEQVLLALEQQTIPPDQYEIIVSIDGSDDGTREMVERRTGPCTLRAIWQPNQGRAAACNQGVRAARGEFIVLLDDDMVPRSDFLEAHLHAQANDARRGVVGSAPIQFDDRSPTHLRYIGNKFNYHLEKLAQPGFTFQPRDFYSGNFSIRRSLLVKVGMFDEAFQVYGNEDIDLFLRLTDAQVALVYSPQALAVQHYTKDFVGLARDNMAKGRTAVLLAIKHPESLPHSKLSAYNQSSNRWRHLRSTLIRCTMIWPGLSSMIAEVIKESDRFFPGRLYPYYDLIVDYFFWYGVSTAIEGTSRDKCKTMSQSFEDEQPNANDRPLYR